MTPSTMTCAGIALALGLLAALLVLASTMAA